MTPEKGQQVKCYLRSNVVLEGIVEDWTEAQVVLQSLDKQSLMIVHRPTDDIMLTKIVLGEEPQEIPADKPEPSLPKVQEGIKQKLHEVQETEDPVLQEKNLEELRQLVVEQEKQIIANKTKEHFGTAGASKMTQYSSPYMPTKSAYKPGTIPSWAHGQPPRKK